MTFNSGVDVGFAERSETILQRLADALQTHGRVKRYDKLLERVGCLNEKCAAATHCYKSMHPGAD